MLEKELHKVSGFANLELLARQVVEGFISGLHKSPFHGFSSEFAEHKIYNPGESTKHIDWKLFAKTDKLYSKRFEEDTNLRCHLIIDNSSSMYFPTRNTFNLETLNKIGFSVLAAAAIIQILKKQRDAVGLSVFNDTLQYHTQEKGSERHLRMLTHQLNELLIKQENSKQTRTYTHLHQIAEKLKRRSLVVLFSDMFQQETEEESLFEALQHLKYNKHEVVLFHVFDAQTEFHFEYANTPLRFVDVESGESVNLYANSVKDTYKKAVEAYFKRLALRCGDYKIDYVKATINAPFTHILMPFLLSRQKFK